MRIILRIFATYMGARKLQKFAEFDSSPHSKDMNHETKGKWNAYFKNENPIVLELACGKGDYTVNLAEKFPDKNFIGVDIKGSRLWRGCKSIAERGLKNAAFLRIYIDTIENYFEKGEVSEIWITFPDPQPKKARKRLTHPKFLNSYLPLLNGNGSVNLKTDSDLMYEFTKEVVAQNELSVLEDIPNVYEQEEINELMQIQTYYEKMWLAEGRTIKFISFQLNKETNYLKPE